jgi:Flp pilus assembly pilin Flp
VIRPVTSVARLVRDTRGATLVEFALVAPILLMTLLGLFEMGYNYYIQTQLQGAIQQAARSSTIESAIGDTDEIDARVAEAVHMIVPDAEVGFSRTSYANFSDVSQPEDFTDIDGSGSCNDGEPFEDANGNGSWDQDRGNAGQGGARDAVLYVVSVSYRRAFGVTQLLGFDEMFTTEATTVLRNQPFGDQVVAAAPGNCA